MTSLADRLRARTAARPRRTPSSNSSVLSLNPDLSAGILGSPQLYLPKSRFTGWRLGQETAIVKSYDSDKRFVIQCMPTGAGKSLTYIMEAILRGGRAVFLTSTKGLQDQLMRDFASSGLVDIRGKSNYRCLALEAGGEYRDMVIGDGWTCDDGPCQHGRHCTLHSSGCHYYDAFRTAVGGELIVSNYAMWLNQAMRSPTQDSLDHPRKVDLLVLDEAHNATEELCSFLQTEITREETKWISSHLNLRLLPSDTSTLAAMSVSGWASTAGQAASALDLWMEEQLSNQSGRPDLKKLRASRTLLRKLKRAAQMRGEWVIQLGNGRGTTKARRSSKRDTRKELQTPDSMKSSESLMLDPDVIKFSPVWPREYAEQFLFRSIPKVIFSSATVRVKTATMLDLKEQQMDFFESPSTFPVERRPVYHIPAIQMNYRNENDEVKLSWLMNIMDRIIQRRTDKRAIIHTVSYKRRNYAQRMSRFASLMVSHDSYDARQKIDQFKKGDTAPILISPSVSTGYDFPYQQCEYQIILKIPFPDTRDEVTKRRCQEDESYGPYTAIQELVQMVGRGMRAADDQCETFILDDNIRWFLPKWREFVPKWFMDSYRPIDGMIPAPLPKLVQG